MKKRVRFNTFHFLKAGNFLNFKCLFFGVLLLMFSCSKGTIQNQETDTNRDFESVITVKSEAGFDQNSYLSTESGDGYFALVENGTPAPILVNDVDFPGVIRVAKDLQKDLANVSGSEPEIFYNDIPDAEKIVVVGTIGKSKLIDQLIANNKIDVADVKGRWETFLVQAVESPFDGVDQALVIAGSDKRGTIFGVYDIAEKMGVSPWYWWADVPIQQRTAIYVKPGRHTLGEPAVKYRGIFINDEAPALSGWAHEKFGGFNHKFYTKVYELILRMKGNYLWPAMWGRSLYDDDSLNAPLAHKYGVVIGTSHHEPLMRAHVEWSRYGSGDWNYATNEEKLREFWRKGIERMGDNESIITIGMRGDGDEPMTEGTAIELLERIVKDQREIIADVTGKKPEKTPQMWALYKEVQDYYDKGMRVPEDVTLLLCDDNWGNIRKLPKLNEEPREGGYGIYYHFDCVGGPRNYKWLNTNQIERTWEQMHLAYQHGVDRVWIVNVGDIKPMEFPIQFFLDYAWDPEKWPAERLPEYTKLWAAQQFGKEYAAGIADILNKYTKYNARRKPELLAPETYSLVHYREADRIVEEYNTLAKKAQDIYDKLPDEYRDAYYQLVLFPVKACANLNELYVTAAKNRLYAKQGRATTNALAEKAGALFKKDAELTAYFHKELANGKWNHMMSQTHIGYTYWQQPENNNMPEVKEIELPQKAEMGVAIEGTESWWPNEKAEAVLPVFDPFNRQSYYIDIFNRGSEPFEYEIKTPGKWLQINEKKGEIDKEKRIWISVDWQNVPQGNNEALIEISGPGKQQVVVKAAAVNPALTKEQVAGFVEGNGYVSIEAPHFAKAVGSENAHWEVIPNLGRTSSGVTPLPADVSEAKPGGDSPHLEYKINTFSKGKVQVQVYVSPTLNFHNDEGLKYAVSFDDQPPKIVNIHTDNSLQAWQKHVANNINITASEHNLETSGEHVLKFWMVDPGVVLQKIVVDFGGVKTSYLGPPESYLKQPKKNQ